MTINSTELHPSEILLQIISSIRTLDGRISEIKQGITNNHFTPEATVLMKERMMRLLETRMQLLYSVFDNKLEFNKYIDEDSQLSYKHLKREISKC